MFSEYNKGNERRAYLFEAPNKYMFPLRRQIVNKITLFNKKYNTLVISEKTRTYSSDCALFKWIGHRICF